jgi:phosphatidylethanolamine-binding protein
MVDLDIPTNTPPATSTLLHWLAIGYTQPSNTTAFPVAANGTTAQAYLFNAPASPAAAQPYAGPNPPARIPLTHRYTQVIVDTTGATNASLTALQRAAMTRQGFDVAAVLASANLTGKVVAGNWFTVTNPGPVQNVTTSTTTAAATSTGTARPSATTTVVRAGAADHSVNAGLLGMVLVGAAFLGF